MKYKIISLCLAIAFLGVLTAASFGSFYLEKQTPKPATTQPAASSGANITSNQSGTGSAATTVTLPTKGMLNGQEIHQGDIITYSYEITLPQFAEIIQGILHYNDKVLKLRQVTFPGISAEGGDFIYDTSKQNQIVFSAIYENPTSPATTGSDTTSTTADDDDITSPDNTATTTEFVPNGYDFTRANILVNAVFDVIDIPLREIELYLEISKLHTYGGTTYADNSIELQSFAHSSDLTATAVQHPHYQAAATVATLPLTTIAETTPNTTAKKIQTTPPNTTATNFDLFAIFSANISPGSWVVVLCVLVFASVFLALMIFLKKRKFT
ncbi:MAG: hypothetical protein LBM65_01950 [Oscillospiraceae bacterium]|jgi:hypothetical protein|nr:hypothetical protein [Oscillospiraceae bacterium]